MNIKYQPGQTVTVISSRGPLVRVIVEDLGEVVTVCRKGELEQALQENRLPGYVGFRKADVMTDS